MRLNLEYFQELAVKNGGECLSKEYLNCREKLQFKCSEGHLFYAQPRKIKEGMWCKECSRNRNRKYNIDEDFFFKDTPESFYIAGFIAADGWVGNTRHGYLLGLELSTKDIDHLKRINSLMQSNYPIKTFIKSNESLKPISPNVKEFSEMCSLRISNRNIVQGLERFGIVQAKTYDLKMPEWLKDHELVHHFMRGYIDGDGSFSESKNGISFSMRGTVEFLNDFHSIILKNKITDPNYSLRKKLRPKRGAKRLAFDKLRYGGNVVISKMYDFLYRDNTICLERKRVIIAKSKELAVYGTGRKRKPRDTIFNKDELLKKAKELKSQKKVAEYFGCSSASISWFTKENNIRDEFKKALGKRTNKEIIGLYEEFGTCKEVAIVTGLTSARVSQIVKAGA